MLKFSEPSPEWFQKKVQNLTGTPLQKKAWLLTGLHLHPDSCVLQLETYKWNLANDPSEATGRLAALLEQFPDDSLLITHLTALLAQVTGGINSTEVGVFKGLTAVQQQEVYLAVASAQRDVLACTNTVLKMMRAHPSSIAQHAISAAHVLINHERQDKAKPPLNPLRRTLITDLIPLLLTRGTEFLDTLTEPVSRLFLDLIAQYHVECASVTDLVLKQEYGIDDPWYDLRSALVQFAKLHSWSVIPGLTEHSLHTTLKTVEEFVKQDSVPSSESGVFYSLLFLLLEHSFKYIKAVDSLSLILVSHPGPAVEAGESEGEEDGPTVKRRRRSSVSEKNKKTSVQHFMIAVHCNRFLKEHFKPELKRVFSELKPFSWRWYSLFSIDHSVFDSKSETLQEQHLADHPSDKLKILAQEAIGSTEVFPGVWSLLEHLPVTNDISLSSTQDITLRNNLTENNFALVANTRSKLCLHVCMSLIESVRDKLTSCKSCELLALVMILCQYDIDRFHTELQKVLVCLKALKIFKYKGLLEHVKEVELLEELLFLVNSTEVKLDILKESKKRYNKDDVISALTSAVDDCQDLNQETVISFIIDNQELIQSKFTA